MSEEKKLILLDAYALIFRAYYAFIRNPRITSGGLNTSAIFGFTLTLDDLLRKFAPDHIAVVFDAPHPTFRHEMFPEYKANREKTPEDIKLAVPYIKQIISAYGIPVFELPGYEADDIIGTMAKKTARSGIKTYMVTSDKDYLQLLSDRIYMMKPPKGGGTYQIIGVDDLPEVFHVEHPDQVIDVLALMGDSVDNVPGVPGVGEKTAKKLIREFGSLDKLITETDTLKGKLRENIEANKEQLQLSKQLVTIITDIELNYDFSSTTYTRPDTSKLAELFKQLEFSTLIKRLDTTDGITKKTMVQGSLFGEESITNDAYATIDKVPHTYHFVKTQEDRDNLVSKLMKTKGFCFDTETTGLDPLKASLVGMSFANTAHEAWWVPVPEKREAVLDILKGFMPLFAQKGTVKIGQNLKYDMHILRNYGIELEGPFFDTMLAHYLLHPEQRHNLNFMSERILNYSPVQIESIIGDKKQHQISMRQADSEKVKEYAAEDADITWQLWKILSDDLEEQTLTNLSETIEMPLVEVLLEMERAGFSIDKKILEEYSSHLKNELKALEQEIHTLAGDEFNISSPKQLGIILYEKLKVTDKVKKTKTKQYSTSEETLLQLSDTHPVVNKVLEYRSVRKLLSSYVEPLPLLINPETGRIHTEFNQAIAVTGRLSSANPNLQNIPVREERGREIRKAFVPADDSYRLLSADYSQIELRIMAHLSDDPEMIRAFRENKDIHTATAAKIYEIAEEDVTREMRNHAKTANFGIIYGISAFGLSQRLHIQRTKAAELIEGYFRSFPGVKRYMDKSIQMAREKGYAETLFGRRRNLRDIHSANAVVRGMAERNAINAPIQGTAADIIKLAMINIHRRLKDAGYRSKMILQVHDELLFDMMRSEEKSLIDMVVYEMSNVLQLKVPLVVDYGTGQNWLEAH